MTKRSILKSLRQAQAVRTRLGRVVSYRDTWGRLQWAVKRPSQMERGSTYEGPYWSYQEAADALRWNRYPVLSTLASLTEAA